MKNIKYAIRINLDYDLDNDMLRFKSHEFYKNMKSCKVSLYLWSELYLLQGLSIQGLDLSVLFYSFEVIYSDGTEVHYGWRN